MSSANGCGRSHRLRAAAWPLRGLLPATAGAGTLAAVAVAGPGAGTVAISLIRFHCHRVGVVLSQSAIINAKHSHQFVNWVCRAGFALGIDGYLTR